MTLRCSEGDSHSYKSLHKTKGNKWEYKYNQGAEKLQNELPIPRRGRLSVTHRFQTQMLTSPSQTV